MQVLHELHVQMHIRQSWCVSIKDNIHLHVWLPGRNIVSLQLFISYITLEIMS